MDEWSTLLFNLKVNTKVYIHWTDKNTQNVSPVPLQDYKVTMWHGIAIIFVLGPYFFEEITTIGVKHAVSEVIKKSI